MNLKSIILYIFCHFNFNFLLPRIKQYFQLQVIPIIFDDVEVFDLIILRSEFFYNIATFNIH